MTNDQQKFDFGGESGEETPRKTLYDKILENQEARESGFGSGESGDEGTEGTWGRGDDGTRDSGEEGTEGTWGRGDEDRTKPGSYQGPTTNDQGPLTNDPGPTTNDQGPLTNDPGPTTNDQSPTTPDPGLADPGPADPVRRTRRRIRALFIILLSVMAIVIGYLVYILMIEREESEEMRVTLEMQKESLTFELNELYASYDTLQTSNDSMNVLIEDRQEQIRQLLAIRASNSRKIRIYDEQVKSLRGVLKSYITQVDSLNQANLRLQAENQAQQSQIRRATSANRELEEVNQNLQTQVEKASTLSALMVRAEPIEANGAVARRIRRTEKIRVCFSLAANAIAQRGLKKVYVRIGNPEERVMVKNINESFVFQGESIAYSAVREVEYEGEELPVCIYYNADQNEITTGTYYVDLYMDGERIGTTTFSLK